MIEGGELLGELFDGSGHERLRGEGVVLSRISELGRRREGKGVGRTESRILGEADR